MAPPILAMEPRFTATVLIVAGLKMERARAEVDPVNFLPRVRVFLIMLDGRHDYFFPVETSQKPFFEYLGTPKEHRRWVVYPEAHNVPRPSGARDWTTCISRYLSRSILDHLPRGRISRSDSHIEALAPRVGSQRSGR